MAYSAIVGSFNIDPTKLATETQAITGLGFQPKIVLFWWGGTDLTNVFIGNKITPSSTGNYSTTGVGFQPDALIAVMTNSTSTSSTGLALWFNLGMATGSSAQGGG